MNTSFGAAYQVWVELGLRNRVGAGIRSVQMQMAGVQRQARRMSEESQAHLSKVARQAERYGYVWGNPKTAAEAKKNLNDIHAKQAKLANSIALSSNAGRRAQMATQMEALKISERDVKAKAQALRYTEMQGAANVRSARMGERENQRIAKAAEQDRVRSARTQYRVLTAASNEERNRQAALGKFSHGAFKTAEYSGIGALGIFGALGYAANQAGMQQQLGVNTAMALGFKPGQQQAIGAQLSRQAINQSMAVGFLSSADIATIQTKLAQHLTLSGQRGLKTLGGLTMPVAQFADVMKMTQGVPVSESANVGAMAVNMFGANPNKPGSVMHVLNQFYKMLQSTGAPMDRAVTAMSYFARMGKMLGFSSQSMFDLYGESYRLGVGGGKSGQRIGAAIRGMASLPTTVVSAYFANMLHAGHGILAKFTGPHGHAHLLKMLEYFKTQRDSLVKSRGLTEGRMMFVQALTKYLGAAGAGLMFNMATNTAIRGVQDARTRELRMANVQTEQHLLFTLPQNQLRRFLTNLQTFIKAFGTYALPEFGKALAYAADHMQAWSLWIEKNKGAMQGWIDVLLRVGSVLAAISALSFGMGAVTKIVQGVQSLQVAINAFRLAAESGRLAMLGPWGIVAAAALLVWYFRNPLVAAIKRFITALQSLPIIGSLFGHHQHQQLFTRYQQQVATAFHGATGISAAQNATGIIAIMNALREWYYNEQHPVYDGGSSTTHTHVYIDGKKVAEAVHRHTNRSFRGGLHSSTHTQGTMTTPFSDVGGLHLSPLAP